MAIGKPEGVFEVKKHATAPRFTPILLIQMKKRLKFTRRRPIATVLVQQVDRCYLVLGCREQQRSDREVVVKHTSPVALALWARVGKADASGAQGLVCQSQVLDRSLSRTRTNFSFTEVPVKSFCAAKAR